MQQDVQQLLHSDTPKPASAALRPEFFVILADCTAPGAQHPAVLPPPDPKPKGMAHMFQWNMNITTVCECFWQVHPVT